jgi:hypothetical protein
MPNELGQMMALNPKTQNDLEGKAAFIQFLQGDNVATVQAHRGHHSRIDVDTGKRIHHVVTLVCHTHVSFHIDATLRPWRRATCARNNHGH